MAKPTTGSAAKLLIQIGDGGVPEGFAPPCGLTSKGISFSANSNDVTVPDCNDPDLPAWIERVIASLSGEVSGSGVLAMEALPIWREFFFSAQPKNVRIKIDMPAGDNGGYFIGKFLLTSLNLSGEIGNKMQVEATLSNDGEIAWVDAA